jgi:hypothetical protein
MVEYLSLYEFLGHKAGGELGKVVYEYAKKIGVKVESQQVTNPVYTGKVLMYPKPFLEDYFSTMPSEDEFYDSMSLGDTQDDELPF